MVTHVAWSLVVSTTHGSFACPIPKLVFLKVGVPQNGWFSIVAGVRIHQGYVDKTGRPQPQRFPPCNSGEGPNGSENEGMDPHSEGHFNGLK